MQNAATLLGKQVEPVSRQAYQKKYYTEKKNKSKVS